MSRSGMQGIRLNSALVVGGAGLVGACVCHKLANAGYVPVAYDNPRQGQETRVKWGPLVRGTLFDRDRLSGVMAEYRPDTIIFCPPGSRPEHLMSDPAIAYRTLMSGMLNLLDIAREKSVSQFLLLSNAAVYGEGGYDPIREERSPAPVSPFGSSMMIAERMLKDYAGANRLRYAIIRSFAAAGADADAHLSEDLDNTLRLVPNLIAVAAGLRPHVMVHGSNFNTRDGTPIRDYVHVSDLAEAMLLTLRAIELGVEPRIYNIGSGTGTSALELVRIAERMTGRRIPISYGPRRIGDPATLMSDSSLARVMLGWTTKTSAVDQIIGSAWAAWLQQTAGEAPERVAS